MPEPYLATARLTLTPLTREDARRVFEYRSDPDVSRYQFFEPRVVDDARAFIAQAAESGWTQLGIWVDGGLLAGDVGLRMSDDMPSQVELGVTLAPEHQGRGIATECVRALLTHLYADLGIHRVFASVDPRNAASIALFSRVGMRREAHFRQSMWFKGEWADDIVFALLGAEWEQGTL